MLEDGGKLGAALELVCHNHPDAATAIRSADDFDVFAHDGGCRQQCQYRLECGHACPR